MSLSEQLTTLHGTLRRRLMPEQVAAMLVPILTELEAGEQTTIRHAEHVARHAPVWSSMSTDFDGAAPSALPQLVSAARVFGVIPEFVDPTSPVALRAFISDMGDRIGGWQSGNDWLRDRRNREERWVLRSLGAGDDLLSSRRKYDRAVRVLRHLDEKITAVESAMVRYRLLLASHTGFAQDIPAEWMTADPYGAMFAAYFTARRNKRRMFTLSSRENPMDYLAKALLDLCEFRGTNWEMISWVHPVPDVLAHLEQVQLGVLTGKWSLLMTTAAGILEKAWPREVDRESMIVRRGMDSSTWNETAGAWNMARSGWIGCLSAAGGLGLLDIACPGKVMRLMAADLAFWHRSSGGDVDPNTRVWARLPLPWEVLSGDVPCTRADVERACWMVGLNAQTTGWTAPRTVGGQIAPFIPTPELVHGVAMADPAWASLFRRAGVFSGPSKGLKITDADTLGDIFRGMIGGAVISDLPVKRPGVYN